MKRVSGQFAIYDNTRTTYDSSEPMSEYTISDILRAETTTVEIDDYGRSGAGVVVLADGRLYVPGALPGERVTIEPEAEPDDAGRPYARIVDIPNGSPQRRDPLCDRDEVCRGCHLRHATVTEELDFKVETVRQAVAAHAGLAREDQPDVETITPFPTKRGDAYRIRTALTYRIEDGDAELGLATPVRDRPVPMGDCPALTGAARRLIGYIASALDYVSTPPPAYTATEEAADPPPGIRQIELATPTYGRGLVDIEVGGLDGEEAFLEFLDDQPVERFLEALADRLPEDIGLAINDGETREHLEAPRRIRLPLLGLKLVAGFDDWLPPTLDPTEALYEYVLEQLDLETSDRLLDVGCGIGTLTILASPHIASATGIDINRHSIEAAELNAVDNDADHVEFVPSGWEKALRQLALADRQFDAATINPARSPLGERPLTYLGKMGIDRLVYIGPSPESAGRDLGFLRSKGWEIAALGAANVDPAHYRTTLVARVRRDLPDDHGNHG
ncbi:MAG: class I SAM-dependent RNA methyltransferase [Bradymonadaceae bacterium]